MFSLKMMENYYKEVTTDIKLTEITEALSSCFQVAGCSLLSIN
jgi:hypothetical protein